MSWKALEPKQPATKATAISISGVSGKPGGKPWLLLAFRPELLPATCTHLKVPGTIGVSIGDGEHAGRLLLTSPGPHRLVKCKMGIKGSGSVLHLKVYDVPGTTRFAKREARWAHDPKTGALEITLPAMPGEAPAQSALVSPPAAAPKPQPGGKGFSMLDGRV